MNGLWLPTAIEVCGKERAINADFRDVLDIIVRLTDVAQDEDIRLYVALSLFYEEFNALSATDYEEALHKMFLFISCGEESAGPARPKTIDWQQDLPMIVSDVNKVAGCEIRALPFCHWWTFMSWFNGVGEGQLSTVVSLREKLRKGKKLADWERDYYRHNREKVDFKTKYTASENSVVEQWIGKAKPPPLGGGNH